MTNGINFESNDCQSIRLSLFNSLTMPNKETKVKNALDGLDEKVVGIVGNFVKRRRQHYEEAAKKLHENLKKDAERYAMKLADNKIDAEEFEMLMQGRMAQLKIELLSEVSVSKSKFDGIAGDLLKLTVQTVLTVV